MWIEKLKNGKYRYAERYLDPFTGKQKKVSVTLEKNTAQAKKLAQASLSTKIQNALESAYVTKTEHPMTFRKLTEQYLFDQKTIVKGTTLKSLTSKCNILNKIIGGETLVSQLNAGYVKRCFSVTGKSPSTLNNYLASYKTMIRWAFQNDLVEDATYLDKLIPYKDVKKTKKIEEKYLEEFEYEAILNAMHKKKYKDLTRFLLLTGMRVNEALALTASDIDLQNRNISITKSYEVSLRKVGTPKNDSSVRDIFIQEELFELCKELKLRALAEKLQNGCDALFQDKGRVIRYNAYFAYVQKYCESITYKHITPHIFRHTHASILAENGVDYETISRRLGHGKDSPVTREVYIHVTQKMLNKDKEQINRVNFF